MIYKEGFIPPVKSLKVFHKYLFESIFIREQVIRWSKPRIIKICITLADSKLWTFAIQ